MRVLISNYSSESQTILKAVMIKFGHKVEVVANGKDALAALQGPMPPKLAILDTYLPGMDGFEICRTIKGAPDSTVSLILMTKENDRTEVLKALDAGADNYLQKPFDVTELTARLIMLERIENDRQHLLDRIAAIESGSSDAPAKKKPQKLFTDIHEALNEIAAFAYFEDVLVKAFDKMGLGEAKPMDATSTTINAEFSMLTVLVLPAKQAWVDVLLEMDHPSAQALYKAMTGAAEESRDELVDMGGEALNMIMGAIKTALQDGYLDVLTPVIPFKVAPEKREKFPFISTEQSVHVFELPDMVFRITLFPHVTSVVSKELDDIEIREVLTNPVMLPGTPPIALLNKGTMVTESHLRRLREMTGYGFVKVKFDMISPSQITASTVKA